MEFPSRPVLCAALFALACGKAKPPPPAAVPPVQAASTAPQKSAIGGLVAQLQSEDLDEQDAASAALEKLGNEGLSVEEGLRALEAAAGPFPPRRAEQFDDSAADLVRAVGKVPLPEHVERVVELYGRYDEKARFEALRLLGIARTPAAAHAYLKILRRYQPKGEVRRLAIRPIQERLGNAEIYYPALFEFTRDPRLRLNTFELCLNFFNEKMLKPEVMAAHADAPLEAWRQLKPRLLTWQKRRGYVWMSDPGYQTDRYLASILLDLLGFFPTDAVRQELRAARELRDPRLQLFSYFSRLRLGGPSEPALTESIAANPEQRRWLHGYLASMGRLNLFPTKYLTQEAQAASALAQWTVRPTEMLRTPDAIELMKTYSYPFPLGGAPAKYFLFRFRVGPPHPLAKVGWMAAVAGPYRVGDVLSFDPTEDTFSAYAPWSSRTPDQHVDAPARIAFLKEKAQAVKRSPGFMQKQDQCPSEPSPHRCMIPFRTCSQPTESSSPATR